MSLKSFVRFANACDAVGDKDHVRAATAVDMALQEASSATKAKNQLNYVYAVLSKVAQFSTIMDFEGHKRTADILDTFLKNAEKELPPSANDRDSKYDAKANNASGLYKALEEMLKQEPVESVLETMKDSASSLLTRYSPDYPGVMLMRVSDGVYQDMLTRKVYDFNKGFVSDSGVVHPGGSTAYQTPTTDQYLAFQQVFESSSLRTRPRAASLFKQLLKKIATPPEADMWFEKDEDISKLAPELSPGGEYEDVPFYREQKGTGREFSEERVFAAKRAAELLEAFFEMAEVWDQEKLKHLIGRTGLLGAAHHILSQSGSNLDEESPMVRYMFDMYFAGLQ